MDSSSGLLAKDFENLSRDELHKRLTSFIKDLLSFQPERLANLMYRHDVKESLFQDALNLENIDKQASKIADLIIERELQKVEMRKTYKKYKLK